MLGRADKARRFLHGLALLQRVVDELFEEFLFFFREQRGLKCCGKQPFNVVIVEFFFLSL